MLGEGEARGACVAPSSHADGMAMGRMVGSGELVRLARGHFARRGYWEALDVPSRHLHLARSLSRAHPDWTFCGPTAAVAHGLPVSFGQLARIHVAHGPGGRHGTRIVAFHQLAREAMIELGFAAPELQAEFVDPLSGQVSRVDFLWHLPDGTLVAGELDGRQKYVDPTMTRGRATVDLLADERLRESRLTRVARVVRFSFAVVCDRGRFARLLDSFGVPRA